jgi:uncharacterized protein
MKRTYLLLAFALLFTEIPLASAAERTITIGTAGVTGVYYPAGGAICRLVNRGRKEHGVRCAVESTGGSINNLESIRKQDLELGVVQSDMLYHAYNGNEIFSDVGADKKLRILFSLHSEPFTIVARKDAKIHVLDDLKGKRVSLGPAGSGMRVTMEDLLQRKGWTNRSFASTPDIKANDLTQALCGNKIDAMVYAAGHPNGAIEQVTTACETRLVEVSGATIDSLIAEHPFYSYATIPGGMYPGNPKNTKTFGVKAVLVASSDLGEDTVYQVVKAVFENLDTFKTLHPVFATLEANHMVHDTDVAPIHPGAMRYYKEKGYIR